MSGDYHESGKVRGDCKDATSLYVWMVCNNCGHVDSGPEGAMYECPSCGSGDGWGEESHVAAQRRSALIVERGRFYDD